MTAAPEKAKADLEEDLEFTRTAVEKQNAVLPRAGEREQGAYVGPLARSAGGVERGHLTARRVENRKAEHDLHKAEGRADRAEEDARFAIDFAYSAIVEAEYAALDAALARVEADELSNQAGATA